MTDFREALVAFERSLEARMPEFKCSVHLCLGQEDVPEMLNAALRPNDWLFSTHRSHGHYLAKGGSPGKILAEILGLETGVNGGYSGSQSFCDPALRFHSTAIVGGLIGVAVGAAMAVERDEVVVCCIGDAATEQGVFWESVNFAALHSLPIAFVCENNGLSVHAPLKLRQATPLPDRIQAFGLDYYGPMASDAASAIKATRAFRIPTFAEVHCLRMCKHVSAMEDLRE